ncbi:unnamed protein product [Blepharisma stoltei]|uniref:RING-type domain-containing protein n=1 Tax=Blepharisma stoltei TaxID=1481888 RepID=A0AAU9J8F7_9CILI|nr:unnamed protein product [Blepharisma stoltei]
MSRNVCMIIYVSSFYIVLSVGILAWIGISTKYLYTSSTLSFQGLWNVFVSWLLQIDNVLLSLSFFFKGNLAEISEKMILIILIISGPVLLALCLVGSYFDCINYEAWFCEEPPCAWAEILKSVHFAILYFISIFCFGTLVSYIYLNYIAPEPWRESLVRPLLEIDTEALDVSNGEICSICLENMKTREIVSKLSNCHHTFHKACIERWLQIKHICPLCRD